MRQIRQLPPATMLVLQGDGITRHTYYRPYFAPRGERRPLTVEGVAAFRTCLEECVDVRLRADVPVAFQLSGGLDSNAVVALAAARGVDCHCFTVTFPGTGLDEWELAVGQAERYGARLEAVEATPERLAQALPRAVAGSEGLAVNAHLAGKFLLSRAVAEAGYKVTLTGEGADEVLAGYPHFRQDLGYTVGEASNRASLGLMLAEAGGLSLIGLEQQLGFAPAFLQAKAALGARLQSLLRPEFRQAYQRDCYATLTEDLPRSWLRGLEPVEQSMVLWARTALAGYILRTLGDGAEMAHSVEGRLPFLDHHLTRLLGDLEISARIRGGVEKYILREAVRDEVGETLYRRQKHPFMAPSIRAHLLPWLFERPVAWADPAAIRRRWVDLEAAAEREQACWEPVWMWLATAAMLEDAYRL